MQIGQMKTTLSPKELAQAIGASESTLKRWIDDGKLYAERTVGGHRRVPLIEAVRFIRESEVPIEHPEILGLDRSAAEGATLEATDKATLLWEYLREGSEDKAIGFLVGLYLAGWSLASICDGPVHRAMEKVGELWLDCAEGVFLEHRASEICARAVNEVRRVISVPKEAPVALGGAPSGDPYQIPSLCAATILAGEGFSTMNLGPNTPFRAMIEGVDSLSPSLVWVTVSFRAQPELLKREFLEFQKELEAREIPLAVGGREYEEITTLHSPLLMRGASMSELSSFARGLRAGGLKAEVSR
jgi:excisionase family DNA binding protein